VTLPWVGKVNVALAGAAGLLAAMGLFALWTHDRDGHGWFDRQLVWAGVAAAVMLAAMLPHYRSTRHAAYVLYALALVALVALLVFARKTNGARGWFALGPIKLQPAELAKIAVVMAMARWLSVARDLHTVRGLAAPALIAAVPMALILAQPDLGNAIVLVPVAFAMLYVAGARTKHLLAAAAFMLACAPGVWRWGLKDYQKYRITSFLWPDAVPRDVSFQQQQSIRACAAGGLTGGEGGGYYVPEQHTDFVYSIVCGELGFIGASFMLLLFGILFAQAGRIAAQTREPYGRLVAVGILVFLATQVFVNVGMAIGVAPITGITLPFVSYGGSSLVCCALALGLVLNVGARWVPTFSSRDLDAGHVAIREFVPQERKALPL